MERLPEVADLIATRREARLSLGGLLLIPGACVLYIGSFGAFAAESAVIGWGLLALGYVSGFGSLWAQTRFRSARHRRDPDVFPSWRERLSFHWPAWYWRRERPVDSIRQAIRLLRSTHGR